MGRQVHWDSVHELNAFRLLESDASVLSYAEQPCVVHYWLEGVAHRHVPDILVVTREDKALWEVKTVKDASRPAVESRTVLMVRDMPRFGYQYRLVLAHALNQQPRLANAKSLLRLARRRLPFEVKENARRLLEQLGSLQWADLAVGNLRPLTLADAYALVLRGDLCVDLDRPLGKGSVFTPSANSATLGAANG